MKLAHLPAALACLFISSFSFAEAPKSTSSNDDKLRATCEAKAPKNLEMSSRHEFVDDCVAKAKDANALRSSQRGLRPDAFDHCLEAEPAASAAQIDGRSGSRRHAAVLMPESMTTLSWLTLDR